MGLRVIWDSTPVRFLDSDVPQNTSAVYTFILAMTLYPDVQARARAEINQVVRHDIMPSIDDRPSLPYLDAIFREVLRWCPPLPLGQSAVIWFCSCIIESFAQG